MKDVYVLLCDEKIKIGCSDNVVARANQISSHFKNVKILHIYKGKGTYELELHRLCKDYRIHNEYFTKECLYVLPNCIHCLPGDCNDDNIEVVDEYILPIDTSKIGDSHIRKMIEKTKPTYKIMIAEDEFGKMFLFEAFDDWKVTPYDQFFRNYISQYDSDERQSQTL